MMFCPKCGSLMKVKVDGKRKFMHCSCGYEDNKSAAMPIKEQVKDRDKIEVIEKDDAQEALPIVDAECPKCGHKKARFWTIQTRAADEPETKFMKCIECGNVWRDYS